MVIDKFRNRIIAKTSLHKLLQDVQTKSSRIQCNFTRENALDVTVANSLAV